MTAHHTTAALIDQIIRQHSWFDFHVLKYDGSRLTIAGGIDLTYYHQLEITFENIFFAATFFEEWHSDTSKTVFEVPEAELSRSLHLQLEIEQGYQVFIFHTEDYKNDIYIAAQKVTFNTDTVYYYQRPNLKEGERIADFVPKK